MSTLERILAYFRTGPDRPRIGGGPEAIDRLYAAGGSAVISGLPDALMERSQVPTSVISPFKGMEVSPNIRDKQLRRDAPALLTPCGLAMRRFDK